MRTKKQQHIDTKHHHESMAARKPSAKARDDFKRPAYQARSMLAEQGKQIEHESVTEYLAKKYDIKGEMQVGREDGK